MLRKCLLVALLFAVLVPLAGTAAGPGACYRQCMIDSGCPPGSTNPDCPYINEACRCQCGPPEWCP